VPAALPHVRYTDGNHSSGVAFTLKQVVPQHGFQGGGKQVFSCDYNGWADMPEAEREAIEAFESAQKLLPPGPLPTECSRLTLASSSRVPRRKAA
jgi:hypothetical protein